MTILTAAAVQLAATADMRANIRSAEELVREAAGRGARLVLLPEQWPLWGDDEQMRGGAQPLDGPVAQWARDLARELAIDLVAGSFSERDGDGRLHNTSLHVSPAGQVVATYRKIHMFDVVVAGTEYRESAVYEPGERIVVSPTAGGVGLGMTVCYDLRFPELYRILTLEGARVLLVPAAFTLATTRDHWETLLRARAIENQAFVIAANAIGEYLPGRAAGGRSMIVDPWGVVLAQAGDGPCAIVADLDLDRQARTREQLPSLANRRPAAYRWPGSD
jgi:predicted amidohydrolase